MVIIQNFLNTMNMFFRGSNERTTKNQVNDFEKKRASAFLTASVTASVTTENYFTAYVSTENSITAYIPTDVSVTASVTTDYSVSESVPTDYPVSD